MRVWFAIAMAVCATGCVRSPIARSNESSPESFHERSAPQESTPGSTLAPDSVARKAPPKMFPIHPVSAAPRASASELQISRGRHFSYALPQGWRLGEDGQFALTLVAPDSKALTIMVGNAGVPINYPPGRFIQEKLMALQPINAQISQPRQAAPVAGFRYAYQFEVAFVWRGLPMNGLVKCNISPAYDSAVMAMTGALAEATQWPGYASWLPMVADQISALDGAAFGARGIMAQNLRNSREYGEAAQRYRQWSQNNWQQVTDARNASVDRQNFDVRQNLGGVQTYSNPFESGKTIEVPNQYKYVWMDRQGNVMGSDDPSANPNLGSTGEWRQMPQFKP